MTHKTLTASLLLACLFLCACGVRGGLIRPTPDDTTNKKQEQAR